jgi:hypothetical protein
MPHVNKSKMSTQKAKQSAARLEKQKNRPSKKLIGKKDRHNGASISQSGQPKR